MAAEQGVELVADRFLDRAAHRLQHESEGDLEVELLLRDGERPGDAWTREMQRISLPGARQAEFAAEMALHAFGRGACLLEAEDVGAGDVDVGHEPFSYLAPITASGNAVAMPGATQMMKIARNMRPTNGITPQITSFNGM